MGNPVGRRGSMVGRIYGTGEFNSGEEVMVVTVNDEKG